MKGYFYWSAMDNLEWVAGFGNRYGIVYVDFKDAEAYAEDEREMVPASGEPSYVV